jgi:hypothetical protein
MAAEAGSVRERIELAETRGRLDDVRERLQRAHKAGRIRDHDLQHFLEPRNLARLAAPEGEFMLTALEKSRASDEPSPPPAVAALRQAIEAESEAGRPVDVVAIARRVAAEQRGERS